MPETHATSVAAPGFAEGVEHLDALIARLDKATDPAARAVAGELVQVVMALHGMGLARIIELLDAGPASPVSRLVADPMITSLLVLHGLHPVPVEERVARGLEAARPYLQSHGGNVELLGVDAAGGVHLRLEGSCHGCPSSAMTLRDAIEGAIREAAPEVDAIVIEGEPAATPDPTPAIQSRSSRAPLPLAPVQVAGR